MTGRVFPFDASTHTAADALLPFYVNATLRGEELDLVERHLIGCEQCRQEVDWLRSVFDTLAADPTYGPKHSDAPALPRSGSRGAGGAWRGRPDGRAETNASWARWLIAAQFAAIAILATILATQPSEVATYRTLAAADRSASRGAVAVMFDPATTESEIRRIVDVAGARIVDGPTSTDVFVLDMPPERIDHALVAMRAERAVRFAEPLGPRAVR